MQEERDRRPDTDPEEIVRFCPQCGAQVMSGARFCVECGENLAALNPASGSAPAEAGASAAPPPPPSAPMEASSYPGPSAVTPAGERASSIGPFAMVFAGILAIGVVVTVLIVRQMPPRPSGPAAAASAVAGVGASGAADSRGLPAGHPTVHIPKEALDFITKLEQKANANPGDLKAWNELGDVTLRAAAFDPSYYPKSASAYAHVLKLDPDNLDALRGTGNIDFDQRKFDEAIAAYEHYLGKRPDDPDVRTDLGTMYLSTGNADQAVVQYKKVLAAHPQFFEAAFNLGVAYGQMNRQTDARAAFDAALKIAPNRDDRDRVNQMIAELNNSSAQMPPEMGSGSPAAGTAGQTAAPMAAASTFQGGIEQMLRGLPVAGPKVKSLQWDSASKARVLMDNFPMDQMPPFAASKFMSDLKAGIDQAKSTYKVTGPVELELTDAASGRVMKTVIE